MYVCIWRIAAGGFLALVYSGSDIVIYLCVVVDTPCLYMYTGTCVMGLEEYIEQWFLDF